ncbi:MAG: Crp/Fnr family transcriptional regulator [Pirellulales bacterium]|nr:Crp/Fnr family transcriptional regulator [Pirellulales bacterium]
MPLNVAEILHDCKLFADVPPESFTRLAAMARICRFRKGQLIFRDGEACPGAYVVGRGLVRVYKSAVGGKEHVLHMVGPGETFAEVAAVGRFPCPASAEAVAESTCVLLPIDRFQASLQNDHALCLGMMTGMSRWVRYLVGLIEDVVLRDAAGRLARYLLQASDAEAAVTLPGLKRHVASHLNLTSETLSRTLRRLVEAGLIAQPDATRIKLLDLERLRQVAEGVYPRI